MTSYWPWRCSGLFHCRLPCLKKVDGWRVLELCSDVAQVSLVA